MIEMMKKYRVTSSYGWRNDPFTGSRSFHTGIDLVKLQGGKNAPIEAFVEGTVIHAKMGQTGTGVGGFGNTVIIKDKYNCVHMYAHLKDYCVKVGDYVKAGQVIGHQGSTGRSTGEHLHYEVRTQPSPSFGYGHHTDPVKYLDEYYRKNPPIEEVKKLIMKYFKDQIKERDSWVIQPAERMYEKGIFKGDGNGYLHPNDNMTRGEAVVVADRIIKYVDEAIEKAVAKVLSQIK